MNVQGVYQKNIFLQDRVMTDLFLFFLGDNRL